VTLDRTLRRVSELDASPTEPVLEWDTPLFLMARAQYEQALPYAGVSDMVAERLSFPERAVIVSVPFRRDDGSIVSSGGRVLAVVGTGADLSAAREHAYQIMSSIRLPGSHFRSDIGLLAQEGKIHL